MRPHYQMADFWNYRVNRVGFERRCIYPTHAKWVEAMGYLLGWCLERHRLELYALCLFFNHGHYDVGHPLADGPEVAPRFSKFIEAFHWWTFRLLKVSGGWTHGPVFTPLERTRQGPSLDAEQIWHDLCYDTGQAVAAGFFRHSSDYPGLCFQPENVTEPMVFRRNSLIRQLDPMGLVFTDDHISVTLGIPRPFQHLDPAVYQSEFRKRLDAYESSVAAPRLHHKQRATERCHRITLGKPLTSKHLHHHNRGHHPPPTNTLGPPPVGASDPELKRRFCRERRAFWEAHRAAFRALAAGERNVAFPAGTYGWRRRLNVRISPPPDQTWSDQPRWYPD